jgi:hypothetical protein
VLVPDQTGIVAAAQPRRIQWAVLRLRPGNGLALPRRVGHAIKNSTRAAVVVTDTIALAEWSAFNWSREVRIDRLSPFDRLSVTTRNHSYEIVVVDPRTGDVRVRGGSVFPTFTAARITGSSLGGSTIRLHSINPGFQIEFAIRNRAPIITSRVRTVAVVPAA